MMNYLDSVSLSSIVAIGLIIFYILLNQRLYLGGLCILLVLGMNLGLKLNIETSAAFSILFCILFKFFFMADSEDFSVNTSEEVDSEMENEKEDDIKKQEEDAEGDAKVGGDDVDENAVENSKMEGAGDGDDDDEADGDEDNDVDEVDEGDDNVDLSETFLDAYKSLTPDQVKSMTKDARELLETQKSLMATIKEMTPVVQEGRKMMAQFGGYFGKNSGGSVDKAMKYLGKQ